MEVIRDPLWNNIRVDDVALRIIDTSTFQRLRYVRQLGLAYLVYPGATHTRFEHALGAYHLARRTLALLEEREELTRVAPDEAAIITTAALLHDIGHYPFSHALEEIGALDHEAVAHELIFRGPVADVLTPALGADAPARIYALIRGQSDSPLQGLISGSLDLDKIEYLKRDALMCGVPYGEIDVDRLLHSLTIVDDPAKGRLSVGIAEKGLAALESLLFAKYQMYRNVYWHHAVRSATAMYKRLVDDALRANALVETDLASFTDEGLLHRLESIDPTAPLLLALRGRRLHKRAAELATVELPPESEWIAMNPSLVYAAETALAREIGIAPGELLLDFPAKPQMLGLDIPVVRRGGRVERLTTEGIAGSVSLPTLSDDLYRSARRLRIFVAESRVVPVDAILRLVRRDADEVARRLREGRALLGQR
ncbi:MAG TPA: HD domain-containing protein [Gemmatimonadaceae bacterium]|nr:HD domain-containing protein [Gemmatimonadaceae bacterium]